jgi:flagellar protein FliO/FliZ
LGGEVKRKIVLSLFLTCAVIGVFGQDVGSTARESGLPNESTLNIQPDGEREQQEIGGGPVGPTPLGTWDYLKMLLLLAVIVAAIYGLFYLLKRAGTPKFSDNEIVRVLSTKNLHNNMAVYLVEVGTRLFLLGAGESQVQMLTEIDDKESIDEVRMNLIDREESRGTNRGRFSDILRGMFSSGNRKSEQAAERKSNNREENSGSLLQHETVEAEMDFMKRQRERLKKI